MPQITYTGSQGMVQTEGVQYNVQPQLGASRAFEQLQRAVQGAAQLGGQIKQDNFDTERQALETDIANKQAEWKGMSFAEREQAVQRYNEELGSKYDAESFYGGKLNTMAQKALASFNGAYKEEAVQEKFLSNVASQNKIINDFKEEWATLKTQAERETFLAEAKNVLVTPYEGHDDKFSRKLLENGDGALSVFTQAYNKVGVAIADEKVLTDVLESIPAFIQADGTMLTENFEALRSKLSQISNYEEKSSAYNEKLGSSIVYSIVNAYAEMDETWENGEAQLAALKAYADIDPSIQNKDYYRKALGTAESLKNTDNKIKLQSLTALIQNDGASLQNVKDTAQVLLDRGAYTQEQFDNAVFLKESNLVDKNVGLDVYDLVATDDIQGLQLLEEQGRGAAVKKGIMNKIENTLAAEIKAAIELTTLSDKERSDAIDTALEKAMTTISDYQEKQLTVGTIPYIDNILKTKDVTTREGMAQWVKTVEMAQKTGYPFDISDTDKADAALIKTMMRLAPNDPVAMFSGYKTKPFSVSKDQIADVINTLVYEDEWAINDWEDMNPRNYAQIKQALKPLVYAGIASGIPINELKEEWLGSIKANFFTAQPFYFTANNRIMLPKVTHTTRGGDTIKLDEKTYGYISEKFGSDSVVLPINIDKPNGDWAVYSRNADDPDPIKVFNIDYLMFLAHPSQQRIDQNLTAQQRKDYGIRD
jgi:hypothetical protein